MPAVTLTHSVLDEKKELMKTFFTRQFSFLRLALLSDCRLNSHLNTKFIHNSTCLPFFHVLIH